MKAISKVPLERINISIDESSNVINKSKKLSPLILKTSEIIIKCLRRNGKIVTMGNGGSAADSQHFAAELIGRFKTERKSLAALSLTTDTSIITALGNDYGFENVFSRQCESMVQKNDVVIIISTSGKSKNIIKGIHTAKERGAIIIALTGENGRSLEKITDIALCVPSKSTPQIQEAHRVIMHIICELVEEAFS